MVASVAPAVVAPRARAMPTGRLVVWGGFALVLAVAPLIFPSGLGISMLMERTDVSKLLGPLGLAVWTTVFGLTFSIWLSGQFGMKMASWADACERNIEAWEAARSGRREVRP
jgi:hypothetical protein